MSLSINFEPLSWYKGFAIGRYAPELPANKLDIPYFAVTANGMTGYLVEFEGTTLKELKQQITKYSNNEKARIERLYAN
jgi:hypothetical protein